MWNEYKTYSTTDVTERSLHLVFPVHELQVDGGSRAEQAVGFGFDISSKRRRSDAKPLNNPCESEVHLQLCYSPANAASDAVAKRNGAKVVHVICGIFPDPAIRSEVRRICKVLLIEGCGVVTESQLCPFGDEVSAHHQVILGDSSVAWENWKESEGLFDQASDERQLRNVLRCGNSRRAQRFLHFVIDLLLYMRVLR